jgi:hypothetical protein
VNSLGEADWKSGYGENASERDWQLHRNSILNHDY